MNQAQRDEIYRLSGPKARAYIDLLETMGAAAMKFYLLNANMSHPPECLDQLRSSFIRLGWLDEVEEEEDDVIQEGPMESAYTDMG
jgi:hypothetical protein